MIYTNVVLTVIAVCLVALLWLAVVRAVPLNKLLERASRSGPDGPAFTNRGHLEVCIASVVEDPQLSKAVPLKVVPH